MTSRRNLWNRLEQLEGGDVPTLDNLIAGSDGAHLRFGHEEAPNPNHYARVRRVDGTLSPFYWTPDRLPDEYVRVDDDGDHAVYAHPDHVSPEEVTSDR